MSFSLDNVAAYYSIVEYNSTFGKHTIMNCQCYEKYASNNFNRYIFAEKNTYAACLFVQLAGGSKESGVIHEALPIMLGCNLDLVLRSTSIELQEKLHFGTFLISGNYTTLNPFSANNLTAGYIYSYKNENSYKMNIQQDGVYYKLNYTPQSAVSIEISHDVEMENATLIRGWKRKATDERVSQEHTAALEVLGVMELQAKVKLKKPKLSPPSVEVNEGERQPPPPPIDWVALLNQASPLAGLHNVSKEDYEEFFNSVLQHAPKLDDLSNKTVIWAVLTLHRAIQKFLSSCVSLSSVKSKLLHAIRSGNMFVSYTSKNKVEQNRTSVINAQRSVYETIETNKYNTMGLGLGSVKRNVSSQVKNSKALHFPRDGRGFICPITTKELKGAGEIVHYTPLTINSVAVCPTEMQTLLEQLHVANGKYQVAWDGFLTNYYIQAEDDKQLILKIKSLQPLVVLHVYGRFVNFLTQGAIPVHYSVQYRYFFSSFEINAIPDAFKGNDNLLNYSPYVFHLHEYINKALIPKLGVAVQNLKGSCTEFTSERLVHAFLHSVGYNSALLHVVPNMRVVEIKLFPHSSCDPLKVPILEDPMRVRSFYLQLAEEPVSEEERTTPSYINTINRLFNVIALRNSETRQEIHGYKFSDIIKNAPYHFANIQSQIDRYSKPAMGLYTTTETKPGGKKKTNRTRIYKDKLERRPLPNTVPSLRLSPDESHRCHVMLYCAFGDIAGATTEDGIILDKTLCEKGFRKLGAILLKVLWKKHPSNESKRLHHYMSYTGSNVYDSKRNMIFVGVLESSIELTPIKSKNISIVYINLNGIHQYFISLNNIIAPVMAVESYFSETHMLLLLHYRFYKFLGVGTKIANLHGQKGICSAVADLRQTKMFGYNTAGKKVYPQVLFNTSSLIGRLVASQVCSQINSPDLALGPNGLIIAPIGIIVHHREPPILSNQVKKCDLMTAENGFIGSENGTTLNVLKKQNELNNINTNLTVLELATTMGTKINFLPYGELC